MKMHRFGKTDHSKGFVTAILLTVSLSMACGRSGLLGPDEVEEAAGGADGAITSPGAGGRSSGNSLGGAGAGGNSTPKGGASASSVSSSKPVSGGAGGNGGAISVVYSSTKPAGGAVSVGGGVSAVAGSKPSGGAIMGGTFSVTGGKPSGGTTALGGSTSTLNCTDPKSCGGDVVGTWNVTSSCLTVSGPLDLSGSGLGCTRATVEGSVQTSGMWIAKANGVYSDKTTTSGNLQVSLPASCLKVAGTTVRCKEASPVFASLGYGGVCNDAKDGGCTCPITVKQSGSMGIVSLSPWTSGVYETTGNMLVIDSSNRYGYCVSGTQMTLTPQSKNPPTTGAIIFQKQ